MDDRVKLGTPLLALLLVLLAVPARAERPAAGERRLDALLRAEAARHEVLLRQEEKLDAAAEALARQALDGVTGRAVARVTLWEHDVRDAEFAAHVLLADAPPDDAAAKLFLGSTIDWSAANVGAVAVVTIKRRTAVAFVTVHRQARFRGGDVVVVPTDARPRLVVTDPLGRVSVRRLDRHPIQGDAWLYDASTPARGRWLFELELDRASGRSLAAIWLPEQVVFASTPPPPVTSNLPPADDPLGLGPGGLGGYRGAVVAPESGWNVGDANAPDHAPGVADESLVSDALWLLLEARRRAAERPPPRRWSALDSIGRRAAKTVVAGGRPGRLTQRLIDAEIGALHPEEHLLVAGTPLIAWSLLLSEPASRAAIVGTKPLAGLGVALRPEEPGSWSIGLALEVAEGRVGGGGSWRGIALATLQAARDAHGLPRLAVRKALDTIAGRTADEVAAAGLLDVSDEARAEIVGEVRRVTPQLLGVGVDVLITTDPADVAAREHTVDRAYSEVGLGVVQPGRAIAGHPPGSLVLVLVFVQR